MYLIVSGIPLVAVSYPYPSERALGLQPYFDLNLRPGEGSGAALALPLIDAACAIHNEMVTLAECQIAF